MEALDSLPMSPYLGPTALLTVNTGKKTLKTELKREKTVGKRLINIYIEYPCTTVISNTQ